MKIFYKFNLPGIKMVNNIFMLLSFTCLISFQTFSQDWSIYPSRDSKNSFSMLEQKSLQFDPSRFPNPRKGIGSATPNRFHSNESTKNLYPDLEGRGMPHLDEMNIQRHPQPEKTADYFINSEILGERWDGIGWVNFLKWLYTYNLNGWETSERTQSWNGFDWIDSLLNGREYPGHNYIYTYRHWNGSEWINDYRYTYQYDSSWYYMGYLYEVGDSLNWANIMRTIYYRNNINHYADSVLGQYWATNTWEDTWKVYGIPNYKGRDSIIIGYDWTGTTWKNNYRSFYFYDDATPSYNYIYQLWNGVDWVNYYRYSNSYDTNYYFLGSTLEVWNDTTANWMFGYRYVYTYNDQHQRIEYLYQQGSGAMWENDWRHLYEYDANGNNTRELYQIWGTSWEDIRQWLYEYDSNNLNIKEIDQTWDGANWINEYRYTYLWEPLSDINEFDIADHYELYNNYPNPFNPSTTIRYAIGSQPEGSSAGKAGKQFVTIKVYDLLGREVATLVNEEKSPGTYEVSFEASRLASGVSSKGGNASGVYFYQLKAVDLSEGSGQVYVSTKKMILLK